MSSPCARLSPEQIAVIKTAWSALSSMCVAFSQDTTVGAEFGRCENCGYDEESHIILSLVATVEAQQQEQRAICVEIHSLTEQFAAQSETIQTLQQELAAWRKWVAFAYLSGGLFEKTDEELRLVVATAHDNAVAEIRQDKQELEETIQTLRALLRELWIASHAEQIDREQGVDGDESFKRLVMARTAALTATASLPATVKEK